MRNPRQITPDVPHHFILRGNNRRTLFSYRWEHRLFLRLLERAAHKHAVRIHALALMANHVHLIATPPSQEAASRCVQAFAQPFAQQRNLRRGASGKLFEQRFVSIPLDDAALAVATAYVELNPVRAKVVAMPGDSPWTTYRLHTGSEDESEVAPSLWTPSSWYLGLGHDAPARQAAYQAWVAERQAIEPPVKSSRYRVLRRVAVDRLRRPNNSRAAESVGVYACNALKKEGF